MEEHGLTYFLTFWMHQNWLDFYPTVRDAIRDFVLNEPNIEEIIQCRYDIDQWIGEYTTDDDVESVLKTLKVGYWFSNDTMRGRKFLHVLRETFDEAIKERKEYT